MFLLFCPKVSGWVELFSNTAKIKECEKLVSQLLQKFRAANISGLTVMSFAEVILQFSKNMLVYGIQIQFHDQYRQPVIMLS